MLRSSLNTQSPCTLDAFQAWHSGNAGGPGVMLPEPPGGMLGGVRALLGPKAAYNGLSAACLCEGAQPPAQSLGETLLHTRPPCSSRRA